MTNASDAPTPPAVRTAVPARQRWRLYLAAPAPAGVAGDAGGARPAWPAILATTGLPLAGEEGGRGRAAVAAPLPIGVRGEREVVDVFLAEPRRLVAVRAALLPVIPAGWSLVDLHDVWVGGPPAAGAVVAADYRAVVRGVARRALEDAAAALLGATTLPRERRREKRTTRYDLRPLVLRLEIRDSGVESTTLGMRLAHTPDAVGRPDEVIAAIEQALVGSGPAATAEATARPVSVEVRSIVRERLVMAGDGDRDG